MTAAVHYVQMSSRRRNKPYKKNICILKIIIILILSSIDIKVVQTAITCCSGLPFEIDSNDKELRGLDAGGAFFGSNQFGSLPKYCLRQK